MAEPVFELYDGDPDDGGVKVAEFSYDTTNNIVIVRHESSGEEIHLDGTGLDVNALLTDAVNGAVTSAEITDLEGTALAVASGALGVTAGGIGTTELDLSIAPTWTGAHTWDGAIQGFQRAQPSSGGVIVKRLVDTTSGDELRWKLTSSGLLKVVVWDASAGVERDLWQVDPATQQVDQLATLNFPNITGTPTFASHDHSESGLSQIPSGGILDSAVTEPKLNAADSPNSGEFLSWNGSQLEWAAAGGGVAVEEDGTQLTGSTSVLDFQDRIVATEPATDEIAIDVVQQVAYEPGMVNWPSSLSDEEIWRIDLQSGEVFHLERVEFRQKGGGSSTSASINVYDATAASEIDTVNLGSTSLSGGSSGTGATVLVRIVQSVGSPINAAPVVRGWIE